MLIKNLLYATGYFITSVVSYSSAENNYSNSIINEERFNLRLNSFNKEHSLVLEADDFLNNYSLVERVLKEKPDSSKNIEASSLEALASKTKSERSKGIFLTGISVLSLIGFLKNAYDIGRNTGKT